MLDGQASDPVLSHVTQGSVLGLVMFLIFIHDLPDNIRSSDQLFANDCVLYRKVQVGKDQEKAQSERDSHSKNRGGKKPN